MAFDTPRDAQETRFDWLVIGIAALAFSFSILGPTTWAAPLGLLLAAAALLVWSGRKWPDSICLRIGITLAVIGAAYVARQGLTWMSALPLSTGLALVGLTIRKRRLAPPQPLSKSPARLSLILLQERPTYLDAAILTAVAEGAWGIKISPDADSRCQEAAGDDHRFRLRMPEACYQVQAGEEAYWESSDDAARQFCDLRTQRAIRAHTSWVAVEVVPLRDGCQSLAFARAGQLMAELAGGSVPLALIDAENGVFRCWDTSIGSALSNGAPLECFSIPNVCAVVALAPDDPLLIAAEAEARQRWPEFVRHFSRRHPEQHFSVKAPMTSAGRTEHIWIEVSSISPVCVRGRLGNEPIDLPGFKLGDSVAVTTESVEDWLYVLSSEPVGGFSIPAVERAQQRASV